jgi:hypothetical protein
VRKYMTNMIAMPRSLDWCLVIAYNKNKNMIGWIYI